MKKSATMNNKTRLKEIQERFTQWRNSQDKRGKFWMYYGKLRRHFNPAYSVNKIAQALHLNHTKLNAHDKEFLLPPSMKMATEYVIYFFSRIYSFFRIYPRLYSNFRKIFSW